MGVERGCFFEGLISRSLSNKPRLHKNGTEYDWDIQDNYQEVYLEDHVKLRTLKKLSFRCLLLDNISAQKDKSDKLHLSRDSLYILTLKQLK